MVNNVAKRYFSLAAGKWKVGTPVAGQTADLCHPAPSPRLAPNAGTQVGTLSEGALTSSPSCGE